MEYHEKLYKIGYLAEFYMRPKPYLSHTKKDLANLLVVAIVFTFALMRRIR